MAAPPLPRSLAHSRLGDAGASRILVMLHGIYGRGRNWQGIARALVSARPEYACLLVDLPHHGESPEGWHDHSVAGIAADLDDWMRAASIRPDAVLGHSYGGKVALALAGERKDERLQIWIIDSTPEARTPDGSAWRLLDIIRRSPSEFGSRDDAVDAIVAGGFSRDVAQWMATNLVRANGGFVWRLDFDAMERLLRGFFDADLWPVVEQPGAAHDLHFLKASASSTLSAAAVQRILAADRSRVHLHVRDGGHWIHAERPDEVAALLVAHLPAQDARV